MPIKSKLFIQTLQKSQDRDKISFAFEFNNKSPKKVFGANLPPPNTIKLDLPPNTFRVKSGFITTGFKQRKCFYESLRLSVDSPVCPIPKLSTFVCGFVNIYLIRLLHIILQQYLHLISWYLYYIVI